MLRKFFLIAASSTLILAPAISAAADQTPPVTSSGQVSPPPHNDGDGEQREPMHRVNEEHEGSFESIQLVLVGGAIVIAVGLAYRAGRRRAK